MEPHDVVAQFNACINTRNADGLGDLMTDDHQFIDTAGTTERGKAHCLEIWRGFFQRFPDYKNTFTTLRTDDDVVIVAGYSTCSNDLLHGPALWSAKVRDDKVAEWRVYDDSPANRTRLGVAPD